MKAVLRYKRKNNQIETLNPSLGESHFFLLKGTVFNHLMVHGLGIIEHKQAKKLNK